MDFKLTLLLLTMGVVSTQCTNNWVSMKSSTSNNSAGLGIFDGTTTTLKEHPYIVAINIEGAFICAGTIVSSSWVISIADGVHGLNPSQITVCAGCKNVKPGTMYKTKKLVIHPKYGKEMFDYDYACIQIDGIFKWSDIIKPASLPSKQPIVNSKMIVAGWGDTSGKIDESGSGRELRQGSMKLYDPKICESTFKSHGLVWSDRLACNYNKGKTTLCSGDWGDASTIGGVIYGIFIATLTEGECTKSAYPTVMANIFTEREWIKTTTGAKYDNE